MLLAVARDNPDKRDEVLVALTPIDEVRASTGRRIVADDDDDQEQEDIDVEDDVSDAVVTPLPVPLPPVVLAPVA